MPTDCDYEAYEDHYDAPDYGPGYDYDGIPIPRAFCDVPEAHERHCYVAINGTVYDCAGLTAAELAAELAYDPGECEHGLSADLCTGPGHWS